MWKTLGSVNRTQGQTGLTTLLRNCSELELQAFYDIVTEASGFLSNTESEHWKHHNAPESIAGSIPPSQLYQVMLEDTSTSESLGNGEGLDAGEESEVAQI